MSARTFEIDPVHTFLTFAVRYLAISKVHGRFTRFGGTLDVDWDDLTRSKAHVRVETASIETGNAERDAHLRSADFLDVERFPHMTFHGTSVHRKGASLFVVGGTLALHGTARPVSLEAEYGGGARDLGGTERIGLLARGTIDRRDFGLRWNRPLESGGFLMGDEVELDLSIQGVMKKEG